LAKKERSMKPSTVDDVFDLLDGVFTSAALGAAMELGLFWILAERPLDAPAVAEALGIPVNRCQYWLQLLSSTGLLEQVPEGYSLPAVARKAILESYSQESWAFLAGEVRERIPAVLDLAQQLREPGSVWAAQGRTAPDYFAQLKASPESARRFTRMVYEMHLPMAEELADALDMSGVGRLMDLGGGSGVMSLALLRRYPRLAAVVVDIANVCAAGREILRELGENGMEGRISYHAADFLQDELPSGFDMALICDVGVYSDALFGKIWAALNPGGRLVIVGQFAPAAGVAPATRLLWAFQGSLENPDLSYRTAAEVKDWLARAGFQLLSERPLSSKGTERWSDGWVLIEARK
jgi:SAM-dependent methyltransferase